VAVRRRSRGAYGRGMGQAAAHAAAGRRGSDRSLAPEPAIALLDADEGFAAAIPAADVALARRVLGVPRLSAVDGPWDPPPRSTWRGPVCGLIIISGALCRHVDVGGRRATAFFGPGDVIHPWSGSGETLPSQERWTVHDPVTFAVLDARFALATGRWPRLSALIIDRMGEQVGRAAVHTAIAQLPRVEQRVLAMLWQLGDRFGRVTPKGVAIEVRLTHALIGECVGARRPTVTLALRALLDDGLLHRREDGAWVLDAMSRTVLEEALPSGPAAAAR
jgi:CRP/FNR family cyclic AMP-dependent transcriptional regulator